MEGKDDGMSPGTWGHRLEVGKLWAMGPAMTIYFLMVYGCFQATIAELSSYNKDSMSCKAKNIYLWPHTSNPSTDDQTKANKHILIE